MRAQLFLLCFFLLLKKNAFAQQGNSVLLTNKHRDCVVLTDDTAYYKWRAYDLPPYFTAFDTLVRSSDCSYSGHNGILNICGNRYSLVFTNGIFKGHRVELRLATKKQWYWWNFWHNDDRYRTFIDLINAKQVDLAKTSPREHRQFCEDLKRIEAMGGVSTDQFNLALDSFLNKYLRK